MPLYTQYTFDELGGQIVNGTNGTGSIKIGGVYLRGNAIPVKSEAGVITEGSWTLSNYNLVRSGNNLVVFPVGRTATSPDILTITDFPFDSGIANFGLTLGKKLANPRSFGESIIDNGTSISGGPIFPSDSPDGDFYAMTQVNGAQRLTHFDGYGNRIEDIDLGVNVTSIQQAYTYETGANGRATGVLFSYSTTDGKIGVANFDVDSGEVTANRIFAQVGAELATGSTVDLANLFSSGAIGVNGNQLYFRYQRSLLDDPSSEYVIQQFDPASLVDVGDPVITGSEVIARRDYGGTSTIGFAAPIQNVALQNGAVLYLQGSGGGKYLQVQPLLLANMPAADIPATIELPGGPHVTDENDTDIIIDFGDGADSTLVITPTPDARIAFRNVGNGNEIDLSAFDLDPGDLEAETIQVPTSIATLDELLDGTFDLTQYSPTDYDLEPGEDVTTVVRLPVRNETGEEIGTQLLLFPGIDQYDFLENAADYFLDYEPPTIPTLDPDDDQTGPTNATYYFPNATGYPTTTRYIGGPTAAPGGNNAMGAGLITLIVIGGAALIGGAVGTYKLVTDADFRRRTGERIGNAFNTLIHPGSWFRRGTRTAPEQVDLDGVTVRDGQEDQPEPDAREEGRDDQSQQTVGFSETDVDRAMQQQRQRGSRPSRRVHFAASVADTDEVQAELLQTHDEEDGLLGKRVTHRVEKGGDLEGVDVHSIGSEGEFVDATGYDQADPGSGRTSPQPEAILRENESERARQLQDQQKAATSTFGSK